MPFHNQFPASFSERLTSIAPQVRFPRPVTDLIIGTGIDLLGRVLQSQGGGPSPRQTITTVQLGGTGPIPGPGQNGGGGGFIGPIQQQGVACLGGYHPNKQGSWGPEGFTPKGAKLVKNRRMNPLNPRAAKRAIRRLSGLTAFARAMGFKGDVKISAPKRRRY